MIECLTNPDWIKPQIDFLLFLQNIRIGHFDFLDKFFLSITIFGEIWLPTIICAITYWCIDFRAGVYLISMAGLNSMLSHFLKMIACVYRPWVLSDKIHPSELAVPFAKGYSFPSGHSAMSSSVLGGVAYLVRNKKLFCISLICLILLIGFSRLWLGVHTPQDVISGLSIGLILVFGVNKLINWAEENQNRYLYLILIIDILMILAIIYMKYFGNYKLDYTDGELLVDPKQSVNFTITLYGYLMGLLNGCYLCRRFFPFNPKDVSTKTRIIRGLAGSVIVITGIKFFVYLFIMNGASLKIAFPSMFIMGLFVTLIYPLIFQKVENIEK